MTTPAEATFAQVEVLAAAAEQQPILANLLQLYAHDFSEFYDVQVGADGKFCYESLPLYWKEPGRHPFLVWVDGKLAGFVLVKRGSEISRDTNVWDMVEFFILRGYRRRGIGAHVAHEVWRRFPGSWEVRVLQSNISAQQFWARAISGFCGEAMHPRCVEKDGDVWNVFSLVSGGT